MKDACSASQYLVKKQAIYQKDSMPQPGQERLKSFEELLASRLRNRSTRELEDRRYFFEGSRLSVLDVKSRVHKQDVGYWCLLN